MTDGQVAPSGLHQFELQVPDILDEVTSSVEIVEDLDFDFLKQSDQYADWHVSTPMEPMVRALLFKEIQALSYSELHRYLEDYPEVADSFGFDELPARTTFSRTWSDRFDDNTRSLIEVGAGRIRQMGRERGVLIGARSIKPKDNKNVSKRTVDRHISDKAEEVTEQMQRFVYPVFDFDRAENARYETDAFLELQSHLGLSYSAAESGTKLFEQDTNRENGSPDADTHLRTIKQLDQEAVADYLNSGIGRIAAEARHHLEFARPADVAIDMTYIGYFGQRDELEMVYGAPPSKSYDWCFKFATLNVVGDNVKFTLAVKPVQKGEELVGEIVRDLVERAKEHVSIRMVYADSEFCTVETFRSLDELGVKYVIPSPRWTRVKRAIKRMRQDTEVRQGYTRFGAVADGRTKQPGVTNLVLMPSTKNPEKTVAFTTNIEVDDETEADREHARGLINRYARRWGIENSYKTIKQFIGWTTSKEFVVRFFYFGFAVLLYNMWLLVDLLVQLSLDVEHRYKPRVTCKRFLNLARKQLGEPG